MFNTLKLYPLLHAQPTFLFKANHMYTPLKQMQLISTCYENFHNMSEERIIFYANSNTHTLHHISSY